MFHLQGTFLQCCHVLVLTIVLSPSFQRFVYRNSVCLEMGVGKEERDSIPKGLNTKERMREFLQELRLGSEEWRALKLVILGHGNIGKTTLLHAIQQLLRLPNLKISFTSWIFPPSCTLAFSRNLVKFKALSGSINRFSSLRKERFQHGILQDSFNTLLPISFFFPLRYYHY